MGVCQSRHGNEGSFRMASVRKKILLVEDDLITSLMIERAVKSFGYDVVVVHTGEKALDFLSSNVSIDLILMDLDLGNGLVSIDLDLNNGLDGADTALEIQKTRIIPIIFLTAHTDKEFVKKVKNIPHYGYVVKNTGDYVLESSIKMAFDLFRTNMELQEQIRILHDKKLKYKLFVENSRDLLFCIKSHGEYQFVNDAFASFLGKPQEYFINRSAWQQSEFESLSKWQGIIKQVFQTKKEIEKEVLITIHRKKTHFLTKVIPIMNEQGIVDMALVTAKDISERKINEVALRASRNTFNWLAEDMPAYISVILPDGTITYVNSALANLANLPASELIGENLFHRMPSEEGDILKLKLSKLTEKDSTESHEQNFKSSDNLCHCIKWINRAFFDQNGEVTHYQAIGIDITDSHYEQQGKALGLLG